MNAQIELIEGTNRDLSKSQWFTPPELAQRVVEWAFEGRAMERIGARVLEPSAGNGALVRPLVAAGAEVVAYELDQRYEPDLLKAGAVQVWCGFSFPEQCSANDAPRFDLCLMNPPYEDGQDVAFILHALKFAPRVVGIFTEAIMYGVIRGDGLWMDVKPTRIQPLKRRWFKGAETNYVVLELVKRDPSERGKPTQCTIEWW